MSQITSDQAWKNARTSENARWPDGQAEKFEGMICAVNYKPKFKVTSDDTFFCIGSCFARYIEEHLIYRGFNVLSRHIICPIEEWASRPSGLVNKFTTHSMLNEIEWVIKRPQLDQSYFTESKGKWHDLQLCGLGIERMERCIERREYLIDDYFQRVRRANVIVITLGLTEVWRDNQRGTYLNMAPSPHATKREPGRYSFEVTSVRQNSDALQRLITAIKSINPTAKFIVTVSPVPLKVTFSGQDILSANSFSKAALRCAAEEVCEASDDVDYFPSYEMVMLAPRSRAFRADCRHVSDRTVSEVVSTFLSAHGISAEAPDFHEMNYLTANQDIETLVRAGVIESGFHHWMASGRQENRPLAPPPGMTRKEILAAAKTPS